MANTTEGEWSASRNCVYAGDKMIATGCILDVKDHDERSANLHLMAASKKLLSACEWMSKELSRLNDQTGQDNRIDEQLEIVQEIIREATTNTL